MWHLAHYSLLYNVGQAQPACLMLTRDSAGLRELLGISFVQVATSLPVGFFVELVLFLSRSRGGFA